MKKVAIVGCADSWKNAPFLDLSVEIWTFNHRMFKQVPRFSRYFDLHIPYKNYYKSFPEYAEFLKNNQETLYIMEKYSELPEANIFQWRNLIEKFRCSYFTSSMAWLIANAINEGYEDVSLFGVDLLLESEYIKQKPCIEFWLGVAIGKGIKVSVQDSSNLLKPQSLYGID